MLQDISGIKKILIIRLSSMGDILLATPLIRSIKNQNPSAEIDFVVKEEFFEVIKNNPHLTNIFRYSKKSAEKKELINSLKSRTYNILIDLQNNRRSAELTSRLHARTFRLKKNNIKKFLLVHFKINRLKNYPHIPIRYAQTAGVNLDDEGLEIFTDDVADTNLKLNERYIGLCPGAKHFTKRWPKEYFVELGINLELNGYKIVLFGGTTERETIDEIASELKDPINLCNDSILKTAANMRMCNLIYTNDSGAMHLACAVKIPVIAFFGSTVREFGFFPYKTQNVVLEIDSLPCRPCTHFGRKSCPLKHFKCMRDISTEMAFNTIRRFQLP